MKQKRLIVVAVALSIIAGLALGATVRHSVTVTNFNSGELSPQMEGRVDFAKYNSGARELQNMIVRSQGPVTRRPGTKYIATVKDSNDPTRLIPFEYSTSDAYVLELGDDYMRFYRNGAQVTSGDSAYEVNAPWDANDLFEIQYAQDAQYMRFVHPDYQPYKLVRNSASHTDWSLTAVTFENGPFLDENEDKTITITPSDISGTITLVADANIFDSDHVGALWQITHLVDSNTISGQFWGRFTVVAGDVAAAADEEGDSSWEANSVSIKVYENQTYTVTTGGDWLGTFKIQRSYDDGTTWNTVKSFSYQRNGNVLYEGIEEEEDAYYRVRIEDNWVSNHNERHGEGECDFTFSTDAFFRHGVVTIATYVDANEVTATVNTTLDSNDATWRWAEGTWSDYRGWPRTIEHHEQRCLYGGTASWPQTIWASITSSQDSDYNDFDVGLGDAADAWTYVLPGMNPIQWMKSAEYLMVGTTEGVGRLGSPDKPIDPTWPPVYRLQARNGCAYLDAVAAIDAILYVERGAQRVREIMYTYAEDRYIAPDMTILAEHIGREGIVEIDFQERPDPMLWCVRDDGVLLSFTYQRKHEVLAWARHITGQDTSDLTIWDDFESVAVIPGGSTRANGDTRSDDEVWAVVARTVDSNTVRYVEQFQPLDWGDDPNYCWFVDCGLGGGVTGAGLTHPSSTPGNYGYTYYSENGYIWGVPVTDKTLLTLDAAAAVDLGGGEVGIPYTSNPFIAGESVQIEGTTNYDGEHVLQAGTDTTQLVITGTYAEETLAGTETAMKVIRSLPASIGRLATDSSHNIYYGHLCETGQTTAVTKIESDGTQDEDFLTWPFTVTANSTSTYGLALTSNDAYLYVFTIYPSRISKFNLSSGTASWSTPITHAEYNMAIDASGNAYVTTYEGVEKFSSTTGTSLGNLTTMGQKVAPLATGGLSLELVVDDTLGIVVGGGSMACLTSAGEGTISLLYNLGVRTFDDSAGDQIAVGGTYESGSLTRTYTVGSGHVITDGTYIYVLIVTSSSTTVLYKYSWDGSSLTEVTHVSGPTYGVGLFWDAWDNIVVINQDPIEKQDDVFWYYDTDLSYVSKVEGLYNSILTTYDAAAGGSYIQGGTAINDDIAAAEVESPEEWEGASHAGGLTNCVYADGRPIGTFTVDANGALDLGGEYTIIIAGLNYYSILETMPLVNADTIGRPTHIKSLAVDFIETMGAHVGSDMDYAADWQFSDDDFATSMAPYTGYKPLMGYAPFLRGMTRQPVVYIYEWDPVPMTIGSLTANMEVTFE